MRVQTTLSGHFVDFDNAGARSSIPSGTIQRKSTVLPVQNSTPFAFASKKGYLGKGAKSIEL
jgi:hypothetical protein